jgi:hypothetical protein
VHPVGSFCADISRCTVNKTLLFFVCLFVCLFVDNGNVFGVSITGGRTCFRSITQRHRSVQIFSCVIRPSSCSEERMRHFSVPFVSVTVTDIVNRY